MKITIDSLVQHDQSIQTTEAAMPAQQPMVYRAKAGTSHTIKIDGEVIQGHRYAQGKRLKLTRLADDLLVSDEQGQTLIQFQEFYGQERGAIILGKEWLAPGLCEVNPSHREMCIGFVAALDDSVELSAVELSAYTAANLAPNSSPAPTAMGATAPANAAALGSTATGLTAAAAAAAATSASTASGASATTTTINAGAAMGGLVVASATVAKQSVNDTVNQAPIVEPFVVQRVVQGQASPGQVLASLKAQDPEGARLTFAIQANSDPLAYYYIDASLGIVRLTQTGADAVNAGLAAMPGLQIRVSDGANVTLTPAIAVPINHVPLAPTATAVATLLENLASAGDPLTTLIAIDADGDALTYGVVPASDTQGFYTLNAATGQLALTATGAAWVNAGHDLPALQVYATDVSSGTNSSVRTFDPPASQQVNDAPVVSLSAPAQLIENAAVEGAAVAQASATDEENDSVSYLLVAGTDPQHYYTLDASTGAVTLSAAGAAYVNAGHDLPALQVIGSDSHGAIGTSPLTPVPATQQVNDAPVVSVQSVSAPLENSTNAGDVVATLSATDEEQSAAAYVVMQASNAQGYNAIVANVGPLTLSDVGAAAVIASNSVPAAVTFALVQASDPQGYYVMLASTGQLTLSAAGAAWVNAGNNLPDVDITAIDAGGATSTVLSVHLAATQQVNDAPVVSLSAPAQLIENAAVEGTAVAQASASDEENDSVSYILVAGTDPQHYYALDSSTGAVTLSAAGAAYVNAGHDLPALQVIGTDSHGATGTSPLTPVPATQQVNDAPVASVQSLHAPLENSTMAGFVVATLSATDEEQTAVTFALVQASDPQGYYVMLASTGQLTLSAAGAAWVSAGNNLPDVGITTTDAGGATSTVLTVHLAATQQVNDAPVVSLSAPAQLIENAAVEGTAVAQASASDEENDSVSYILVAGTDPLHYYTLDASTGAVTLSAAGAAYVNAGHDLPALQVIGTDSHGATGTSALTPVPATQQVNDAPVASVQSVSAPLENSTSAGDVVATLSATDEEQTAVTFALVQASDPQGYYVMLSNTGKLTLSAAGAAWVNAGNDLPDVDITATDAGSATSAVLSVHPAATQQVNDAPVASVQSVSEPLENSTSAGDVVATLSVTDEEQTAVTFALVQASDPQGYYVMLASTGQLTLSAAGAAWVNAGNNLPDADITATDSGAATSAVLSVHPAATQQVNDAPVASVQSVNAPLENSTMAGFVVATLSATDEEQTAVTFALVQASDPQGYYVMLASTGQLTLSAAGAAWVNAGNNLPDVDITATDAGAATSAVLSVHPAATQQVNDAPVASVQSVHAPLENSTNAGDVVATLSATDEEQTTVTFALVQASDPQGYYVMLASTGQLTLSAAGAAWVNAGNNLPDVDITATDAGSATSTVLSVHPAATQQVNDAPVASVQSVLAPLENSTNAGFVVATLSATDEEQTAVTFALVQASDPQGYYVMLASTGQLTLSAAGAAWVNAGNNLPDVDITATDAGAATSAVLSVHLVATQLVNDAPVVSLSAPAQLIENAAVEGTAVAQASASDEENDSVSYLLVAGTDPLHYYALDSSTGAVTLSAAGAAYVNAGHDLPALQVVGTDSHGATGTSALTPVPATQQVNDAPVASLLSVHAPLENSTMAGFVLATLSATDEEGDSPFIYSIPTDANPDGLYAVNGSTNQLVLSVQGAAWVNAGNNLPDVGVVATDARGATSTALTVHMAATQQVNDAPIVALLPIDTLIENEVAEGSYVTTAMATDEDQDALTITFANGIDPDGYYAIDHTTGVVTLTAYGASQLNVGQYNLPALQVVATDIHGVWGISDLLVPDAMLRNDGPVVSVASVVSPLENSVAAGFVVATLSATDEEGDLPVSYELSVDASYLGFCEVDAATGLVSLTAQGAAWVNAGNDLPSVDARATDSLGALGEFTTVSLLATTQVNDAPLLDLWAVATPQVAHSYQGTVMARCFATDEEDDAISFQLAAGSDPYGYYAIDDHSGDVTLTYGGESYVNAGYDLYAIEVVAIDARGAYMQMSLMPEPTIL